MKLTFDPQLPIPLDHPRVLLADTQVPPKGYLYLDGHLEVAALAGSKVIISPLMLVLMDLADVLVIEDVDQRLLRSEGRWVTDLAAVEARRDLLGAAYDAAETARTATTRHAEILRQLDT